LGSHWYDRNGNTVYEVVKKSCKKGGMRPTTLSDARKLMLAPGVTEILNLLDKPAVTEWRINNILDAVINHEEQIPHPWLASKKQIDEFKSKIKQVANNLTKEAQERGTDIHDQLEAAIKGGKTEPHVEKFFETVKEVFGDLDWVAEDSFCHSKGFGGKIDLHAIDKNNKILYIVDYKTKIASDMSKVKLYDNHYMQLAAYAMGLIEKYSLEGYNVVLYNIFIAHDWSVDPVFLKHEDGKIKRATEMFSALIAYYHLDKGYWDVSRNN
jgi:hypothetical protein